MKEITVPVRRWYDNTRRCLQFPDRWNIEKLDSPGHLKTGLSEDEIKDRINHPVNGKTLKEIASGRKEAVIVFDDMTRPTPAVRIIPHLLEILHCAGFEKHNIRFLWALGSHGTYDLVQARKKLGENIVRNYCIYNHDAFQSQNNVKAGVTHDGVEVFLNREYMNCDLKIGIESIFPHPQAGWSGGGKLILPGIASIDTIAQFHYRQFIRPYETGPGRWKENPMVSVFNEAAALSGLDFKIDCLINDRGEATDIYAGAPHDTFIEGIKEAQKHYLIKPSIEKYDVVIANSYAKATEAAIAVMIALSIVKKDGVIVLLIDVPEGQVSHYVFGAWGTFHGGRMYKPIPKGAILKSFRKLILNMAFPDKNSVDMICHRDDAIIIDNWESVIDMLNIDYPGEAAVAVLNDGTMQYLMKE